MPYTLVYTDCCAGAGGDFIAAAKEAYYMRHRASSEGAQIVLLSSAQGVLKFKQLFVSTKANAVNLWGVEVLVYSLAEARVRIKPAEVTNYVEVAWCRPCPRNERNYWVTDTVKTTVVALHCYEQSIDELWAYKFAFTSEIGTPRLQTVRYLGFGKNREGQVVVDVTLPELEERTQEFTAGGSFGFAYLNAGFFSADKLLRNYFNLILNTTTSVLNTTKFVVVGDLEQVLSAAGLYLVLRSIPIDSSIKIFSPAKNRLYRMKKVDKDSLIVEQFPFKTVPLMRTPLFEILHYETLPNLQMRKHMQLALPVMLSTGVESTLEALYYSKICFYQYNEVNKPFVDDYLAALKTLINENCDDTEEMKTSLMAITEQLFQKNKPIQLSVTMAKQFTTVVLEHLVRLNRLVMEKGVEKYCRNFSPAVMSNAAEEVVSSDRVDSPSTTASVDRFRRKYYEKLGLFSNRTKCVMEDSLLLAAAKRARL